jgi:hypothetical protein
VRNSTVSQNSDSSEGGSDALMQAIVCNDIGSSPNRSIPSHSRREHTSFLNKLKFVTQYVCHRRPASSRGSKGHSSATAWESASVLPCLGRRTRGTGAATAAETCPASTATSVAYVNHTFDFQFQCPMHCDCDFNF